MNKHISQLKAFSPQYNTAFSHHTVRIFVSVTHKGEGFSTTKPICQEVLQIESGHALVDCMVHGLDLNVTHHHLNINSSWERLLEDKVRFSDSLKVHLRVLVLTL